MFGVMMYLELRKIPLKYLVSFFQRNEHSRISRDGSALGPDNCLLVRKDFQARLELRNLMPLRGDAG